MNKSVRCRQRVPTRAIGRLFRLTGHLGRTEEKGPGDKRKGGEGQRKGQRDRGKGAEGQRKGQRDLSLIHISEPTRPP